ncbi:MAG: cyclic nucleotide-binding domain-containing protein [Acidimicrobiales bacterium]
MGGQRAQLVLDVGSRGRWSASLAAIDGGPRTATVSALTELRVLAVPAGRFRALLGQQPSLNAAVLALLAGRVRVATERQVELGANDALGRVCRCCSIWRRGRATGRRLVPGAAVPARPGQLERPVAAMRSSRGCGRCARWAGRSSTGGAAPSWTGPPWNGAPSG